MRSSNGPKSRKFASLGATLKKLGWRATMVVGVLGHAARFAVFAYLPEHAWLVVTINAEPER